ncbi:hypothetical protein DID88_009820 [Monilinia fructigena]|uniref:Uncharacterized protein n=1 Tax=Monilinia fructigena TaxID=38457 RepID=A0A395ILG8_9HELO|nr:hypothetical protein DID88_009820 [Monilinia fructigena]
MHRGKSIPSILNNKNSKKSKNSPQIPATADEYLAAGVDFEEAGEKWRGGDAVKSTRFFIRAVNNYEEALKKFPNSFDLAYNKARVLYELTQYPKLAAQLPGALLDHLTTALEASRYALGLKQDNADILFNTAQVLTNPDPDPEEGRVLLSDASSQPPQDDRWATIVEPVTLDTLLDTLIAQLQTLATLCGLVNVDAGRGLAWIEEYSTPLIGQKLQDYLQGTTDREQEAGLAKSNFIAALADANFRVQRIDLGTYERVLNDAYSSLDLDDHPEGLCDKAEAFISYNASLRLNYDAAQSPDVSASRWKVLSAALDHLTKSFQTSLCG